MLALLSGAIGVVQITARPPGEAVPSLAQLVLSPVRPAWFLVIVLAVLASAGEFQHHTVRTTLVAAPQRVAVLLAKGAGAAAVTLSAVLVTALVTGASSSTGTAHDWGGTIAAVMLGALWALLATGLGMLTRNIAAAITARRMPPTPSSDSAIRTLSQ